VKRGGEEKKTKGKMTGGGAVCKEEGAAEEREGVGGRGKRMGDGVEEKEGEGGGGKGGG
jgi:hypothetical protein